MKIPLFFDRGTKLASSFSLRYGLRKATEFVQVYIYYFYIEM